MRLLPLHGVGNQTDDGMVLLHGLRIQNRHILMLAAEFGQHLAQRLDVAVVQAAQGIGGVLAQLLPLHGA